MDFKKELCHYISKEINLPYDELQKLIEIPQRNLGNFALPCFKFAKERKKSPQAVSEELSNTLKGSIPFIENIVPSGPYLNFFINKSFFAETVLKEAIAKGDNYGSSDIGKGKTIVIDYSSPNIAKPFHVGHLRSTVIGQALYNIYAFLNYSCIGVNHLGDWGTQFGKLIVAYKLWSSKEEVEEGGINALNSVYVKFHEESEKDPSLNDKAREYLLKMEEGDVEALAIWQFFNDISLKEFEKVYAKLGVSFDYYTGESFYSDKMPAVINELTEKNLLINSNGAQVVDLEQFNLQPCLILRSDGGTLYPTRDLATVIYRKNKFDFHKALYVTAADQSLHFAQFFRVIQRMGYSWWNQLHHIPFGLVSLSTGKLSTRKGNVVLMEDLLNLAVKKAYEIIQEKNPTLENKETISNHIGIGSIIFNDLYNSRIKDVTFSLEKMLNFEGETGPFVQYSHVRACSLLEKGGNINFDDIDYTNFTDEASQNLISNIYYYKEKLIDATEKNEPYIITRHLIDLAQVFNKFYQSNQILTEDKTLKNSRLALVFVTKKILENGLKLLGIKAPNKM